MSAFCVSGYSQPNPTSTFPLGFHLPLGTAAVLGAAMLMPESRAPHRPKIDLLGSLLVGSAMLALIYPLIQGRPQGWPAWIFAMLAVGVLLLAAFALYERRRRGHDPLIEPTLLGNRTYLAGLAVLLAFFGAFGGILLCISLFGQLGEGWSPVHAGLSLMPMVIGYRRVPDPPAKMIPRMSGS